MNGNTRWTIDQAHTDIAFKIKHLMISNVKGRFKSYELDATTEDNDFTTAKIVFKIDPNSIDTNSPDRDTHLRSDDFFDVKNHGEIVFRSTKIEKLTRDDVFKLYGDLTIRGITKPIELQVEYNGTNTDPWGNVKAGVSVEGTINRKDWGLNWNAALEAGGWLVGDNVKIVCDVQLMRVKEEVEDTNLTS